METSDFKRRSDRKRKLSSEQFVVEWYQNGSPFCPKTPKDETQKLYTEENPLALLASFVVEEYIQMEKNAQDDTSDVSSPLLPQNNHLFITCEDSRGPYFDGSEGSSTPERIDKEDFSPSAPRTYNSESFDEKWEQRYLELGEYLKKHGHFSMERSPLERWVHRQRSEYKSRKLSEYRIKKLESLGFPWDPFTDIWNKRFQEWKEYKKSGARLSSKHPILKWEAKQRWCRQHECLSDERVDKLDKCGFQWLPPTKLGQKPIRKRARKTKAAKPTGWLSEEEELSVDEDEDYV